jgi:hypothetical protein
MIPEDLKKPKGGGRPSHHSLLLTESEYNWCRDQLRKRASMVKDVKSSKKVKNGIASLDDKFTIPVPATPPLEGFVVKMSRDELQVLNQIVSNTVTGIRDKVLPEYGERFSLQHPRALQAMATMVMLLGLMDKGMRIYDSGSHRRGNGRVQKS